MASSRAPIIAGHSHIPISGLASTPGKNTVELLPSDPRFATMSGGWPRDADYFAQLINHVADRTVFLFWGGNQHMVGFLVAQEPAFDLVVSRAPDLPLRADVEILPEALLLQYIAHTGGLEPILAELTAVPGCRVVICGTPPPKGSRDFLKQKIAGDPAFVQIANDRGLDIANIELSEPLLLYKLWILLQDFMAEVARAGGAEFEPSPASTMTEEGFLRPEYWGGDVTHAGPAYGDVVRNHLHARFPEAF